MDKQLINYIDALVSEREELRRNIEACKNELNVLHHNVEKIDAAIKDLDLMLIDIKDNVEKQGGIIYEKMYIQILKQAPFLFDDCDKVKIEEAASFIISYIILTLRIA